VLTVGQINWGDFPTWVAVGVAAIGGTVALIQLRQQSNVLRGEVERNKRRDELLDSQLRDMKERQDDRVREQAERISVSWDDENECGTVVNGSRRPITQVVAGNAVQLPDGGTNTHQVGQWRLTDPLRTEVRPIGSAVVQVVRPQEFAECLFEPNQLQGNNRRLSVRFHDDASRRWQLDEFMHLERAPDDGW
jgi:hypothetical protein